MFQSPKACLKMCSKINSRFCPSLPPGKKCIKFHDLVMITSFHYCCLSHMHVFIKSLGNVCFNFHCSNFWIIMRVIFLCLIAFFGIARVQQQKKKQQLLKGARRDPLECGTGKIRKQRKLPKLVHNFCSKGHCTLMLWAIFFCVHRTGP